MKRKTNDRICEESDARRLKRLQDEEHTSTRTPVIPVVNRSNSSFFIAFGAVQVFIILSVLGLHVNLIWAQNRFFRRPTMQITSQSATAKIIARSLVRLRRNR